MTRSLVLAVVFALCCFANSLEADARTFGGFDCTIDCSGHVAGYRWAEARGIEDEDDCPYGSSLSFHEGCIVYVREPTRGSDEDDDGDQID